MRDRNQGTLLGVDKLLGSTFKKSSVTNPNLLEEGIDALVSRGCSSLEESVGKVFGTPEIMAQETNNDIAKAKKAR